MLFLSSTLQTIMPAPHGNTFTSHMQWESEVQDIFWAQLVPTEIPLDTCLSIAADLHRHHISLWQSTFGMWWNRRFASWMCCQKICTNCVTVSGGWSYLRNVSSNLLIVCHKHLWYFLTQKGVQSGIKQGVPNEVYSACIIVHGFKLKVFSFFCSHCLQLHF